ncbi:MAG: L-threonylcarbamoyladenylate synthase, partial [Roseovarius sp.]|nr:L-threonylcarbamoyladenylate synthase [Roseovarius sp.]
MNRDTVMLDADRAGCARAAGILRAGGLVAFPTETVYGLGADATCDRAVARIFAVKERPRFNPLIAHVEGPDMARRLVRWPHEADILAGAFWPGPLTLVLPLRKGAQVSGLVTAGLSSLAVRAPSHPVAQAILAAFGGPVAAPSANRSGRISPTTA